MRRAKGRERSGHQAEPWASLFEKGPMVVVGGTRADVQRASLDVRGAKDDLRGATYVEGSRALGR